MHFTPLMKIIQSLLLLLLLQPKRRVSLCCTYLIQAKSDNRGLDGRDFPIIQASPLQWLYYISDDIGIYISPILVYGTTVCSSRQFPD